MSIYRNMMELPVEPSVIAFLNLVEKKVYITWALNPMTFIARNVSEIKGKTHRLNDLAKDHKKLTVKILESHKSLYILKQKHSYWVQLYLGEGWTLYNPRSNHRRYKIKVEVVGNRNGKKPIVQVVAIDSRRKKEVIGRFKTMEEGRAWQKHILSQTILVPIRHPSVLGGKR